MCRLGQLEIRHKRTNQILTLVGKQTGQVFNWCNKMASYNEAMHFLQKQSKKRIVMVSVSFLIFNNIVYCDVFLPHYYQTCCSVTGLAALSHHSLKVVKHPYQWENSWKGLWELETSCYVPNNTLNSTSSQCHCSRKREIGFKAFKCASFFSAKRFIPMLFESEIMFRLYFACANFYTLSACTLYY